MQSGTFKKILLLSTLLFSVFKPVLFIQAPEHTLWLEREPTPKQGGYGECVVGTGEQIYVTRAHSTGNNWFGSYDPSTDIWMTILEWNPPDPLPRPKSGTSMVWNYDDYIYILFGGSYSDTDRRYFYRYQISSNTWEELADSPSTQGAGDAMTWSGYDNNIYAFLGNKDEGSIFARYTPSTNTWHILSLDWDKTDDGASLVWTGDKCLYALRGEWEESTPHTETARCARAKGCLRFFTCFLFKEHSTAIVQYLHP
jgi:hypothetical protein